MRLFYYSFFSFCYFQAVEQGTDVCKVEVICKLIKLFVFVKIQNAFSKPTFPRDADNSKMKFPIRNYLHLTRTLLSVGIIL